MVEKNKVFLWKPIMIDGNKHWLQFAYRYKIIENMYIDGKCVPVKTCEYYRLR